MKKVILGSLVAMMAVSAANAEIASVEYVGGKTGDIAELTTTAKSNLTAAVNELNTGVKAAATKTELSEGLGTKQDTISDLATIRSGATAGSTALQQAAIVNAAPSAELREKVAPSFDYTTKLIDEANTSIGDLDAALGDLEDTVAANKTAADEGIQDAKDAAAKALTDAKDYADGLAGNYDAAGSAATAKSEAIAAAAADATTKADAAKDAAIAADRKSTRLNSSHHQVSRMPSSA